MPLPHVVLNADVKGARILVVDDVPANIDVLTAMLDGTGYDVAVATSGRRAIELTERLRPDVVLLDIHMPGLDGFEVCRRLKRGPAADVPVIFVTGQTDDVGEAFQVGATDFISKPVRADELRARLRTHVRMSALVRGLEESVRLRTAELIDANVQLREQVRERELMGQRLDYVASHDLITHAFNASAFETLLGKCLAQLQRQSGQACLIRLDVDRYETLRRAIGPDGCHDVLRGVYAAIKQVCSSASVGRPSGGTFLILAEGRPPSECVELARTLNAEISATVRLSKEVHLPLTLSIGVLVVDTLNTSVHHTLDLLAAVAHELSKGGGGGIKLWDRQSDTLQQAESDLKWIQRLHEAMSNSGLLLYRQNIVPLSGEVPHKLHFEVLLRMESAAGQTWPPGLFLPPAERANLMQIVDKRVLEMVIAWMRDHGNLVGQCAINLSGQSVGDEVFLDLLEKLLASGRVEPSKLCFEITETAAIRNGQAATDFVAHVRELGCSFALDDFGSGFASYAHLKTLPADWVKIDGSFVKDMAVDQVSAAMVASINEVAHVSGKRTIAEYVETAEVLDRLKALGVDYGQGYFIHKPEPL